MTSSLIIATYNWPGALDCCLRSVLLQRELPNEVVIADDGSRHDTREVIDAYRKQMPVPLKHVWHEDEGFRLGMIRNKAMAAATGEYLIQVDGDLILQPMFVRDHLRAARKNAFIGGSRVLLNAELSKRLADSRSCNVSIFMRGVSNKLNGLRAPALARLIESLKKEKGIYNMRGCNMSFWKSDIVAVNGYNEDISGWGREDTELAIRLYNKGLSRVYFKLQGVVYHLFHKEYDRSSLLANDEILNHTIARKLTYCNNGISKYL